jgi:tetratricopeptide (TPR) repeat protein
MGPRAQDAHLNLAGVLTDTGRADEAIAAYEKAIELGPSYARAHGALVQALCKSGRFTEAKAAADRFLSVLPTDDPNHQRAAQLVASCAAFLEYEKQLPDVLSGKAQPDPCHGARSATCAWRRDRTLTHCGCTRKLSPPLPSSRPTWWRRPPARGVRRRARGRADR